ncbi:MAG TPA: hypothetical protein VGN12_18750 [Pirellulales bacterium]|jgi:hypothetical protein
MRNRYDTTPPASWLARARYTPLADALRGELSAQLDPRTLIAAARLPAPLAELIYTVVRRTRLWRREKVDVTRELIAHFTDGLETGLRAERLVADFGPPETMARLIRRGKIRNRTWIWHCGRMFLRASGVTLLTFTVVYAVLAARFYFSAPTMARNYWLEANQARETADAAWPLYREALVKLGDPRDQQQHPRVEGGWFEEGPGGAHRTALADAVKRQQKSIELTRAGAKKPRLGFLIGDPADHNFYRAAQADWLLGNETPPATENQPLINAILSAPQQIRDLARLLVADAYVAAEAADGSRVVDDYTAILALSEQLHQPHSFLVDQLISLAIFGSALENLDRLLADSAGCLTDDQLRTLAHRIAAYRGGRITVDFSAERALFDDILQRAYTDDGHGDGRLTAQGLNVVGDLAGASTADDVSPSLLLFGPGMSAVIAGRAESRAMAARFLDEIQAAYEGPPWLWDAEKTQAPEKWLKEIAQGPLGFRYLFPAMHLPGTAHARCAAERMIQCRDATETVIALVLWHRRNGAWPQTLDELVPDLLPEVPTDRFDGKPLRYTIRAGQPILYSIGIDRDDDGGQPTKSSNRTLPASYGPVAAGASQRVEDGDWILWPPESKAVTATRDDAPPVDRDE